MLNNAGKKIIFWSQILLIAGIALSVITGIFIIWRGAQFEPFRFTVNNTTYLYRTGVMGGGRVVAFGFLVMIFGSLGSWLCALLLRAFGDLSADTRAIRERLEETSAYQPAETPEEVTPEASEAENTEGQ